MKQNGRPAPKGLVLPVLIAGPRPSGRAVPVPKGPGAPKPPARRHSAAGRKGR